MFNPKLSFSRENLGDLNLKLFTSAGPIFATEKLMDYFYGVDSKYVTPQRATYDADAGYLGSNVTLGLSKRFNKRFRLLIGARFGFHHGATNDDSPLFRDDLNIGVFSAFAWTFASSSRPAKD